MVHLVLSYGAAKDYAAGKVFYERGSVHKIHIARGGLIKELYCGVSFAKHKHMTYFIARTNVILPTYIKPRST